ncbi:hypothetical protein E3N88_13922 [Mikania micrantha]|uniref:Uncharacterized protein n=1 Tax=Mikania micrantha TaxID=192012 RepID=A0A5N6P0B5_9ASTR|nr:hypothetical protein E3N88_13922 [Mikania micrantha]
MKRPRTSGGVWQRALCGAAVRCDRWCTVRRCGDAVVRQVVCDGCGAVVQPVVRPAIRSSDGCGAAMVEFWPAKPQSSPFPSRLNHSNTSSSLNGSDLHSDILFHSDVIFFAIQTADKGKAPLKTPPPYVPESVPIDLEFLQEKMFVLEHDSATKSLTVGNLRDSMLKIIEHLNKQRKDMSFLKKEKLREEGERRATKRD